MEERKGDSVKTFLEMGDPYVLGPVNYERTDEEVLCEIIKSILKEKDDVVIGKKIMGPWLDYYDCSIGDQPFSIIYDLDYGTYITSKSLEVVNKLREYLENA